MAKRRGKAAGPWRTRSMSSSLRTPPFASLCSAMSVPPRRVLDSLSNMASDCECPTTSALAFKRTVVPPAGNNADGPFCGLWAARLDKMGRACAVAATSRDLFCVAR